MTATTRATATDRRKLTMIRAARLFDGADSHADHAVVVDGHSIVAVDHAARFPADDSIRVVDLGAATLLPGLVDTHVHLCFDAGHDVAATLAEQDDDAVLATMTAAAQRLVAAGVTTVRDLGDRGYLSLRLRDAQWSGLPTILAAGPPITSVGGHCHYLGGETAGIDGIRDAVREHADRDVDVIKIMASGGHLTPGTRTEIPQFSREELHAAVAEAHRFGLPVTTHAHGIPAIEDAIAAGVDGMEHATFQTESGVVEAPEPLLAALIEHDIVVGLTLGVVPLPDFPMPPFFQANLPKLMANMARVIAAEVPVVLGTDAGISPVKPHDVLPLAVAQFAALGAGAERAVRTVTSYAAEVIGLGHRKGRIAAGYDADLLAVDGDPLTDPTALQRVQAVFVRGELVARR